MNMMDKRAAFGVKGMWLLALLSAAAISLAGHARATEKDEQRDEKDKEQRDEKVKDKDKDQDLPAAVLEAADKYAPDIKIQEVRTREIAGHPKVFLIEGESEDRDVVLHITEGGQVLEVRFHDRPEGVKPVKLTHTTEELPEAVRETADRIFPRMEVAEVRSHQSPHEEKVFHITGRVVEDGKEREVVLVIEADGDLLEARVFKPRIVTAAENEQGATEKKKAKEKNEFDD